MEVIRSQVASGAGRQHDVYCVTSGPTLPDWLGERARRNLSKRDVGIRRRIELLQDLQMPTASNVIRQSPDGRYILTTGTYKPRLIVHDVHELSQKFERHLDAEAIDACFLAEQGCGKFALLLENRTIAFHAPYGAHTTVRIPRAGRQMIYEKESCELIVAASSAQLYRYDLAEGRFAEPLELELARAAECLALSKTHPLLAVGCHGTPTVAFWDSRMNSDSLTPFCQLNVNNAGTSITALQFDAVGRHLVVGSDTGCVSLYDLRSSKPLWQTQQSNEMPIHTLAFHSGDTILSGDKKIISMYSQKAGKKMPAHIEPPADMNSFQVIGDETDPTGASSGLILCALEQPQLEAFYVPSMGPAPSWCSFLDSLTEELEEGGAGDAESGEIYDDYKFVTRSELEELQLTSLIGTPLVRGYMHGFFLNSDLYQKLRSVSGKDNFDYEEYRKQKTRQAILDKQATRIAPKQQPKKKPKVNADLASRLQAPTSSKKKDSSKTKILEDDRFGSLFTNPDYQIDESDINFKLRNPSGVATAKLQTENDMDSDEDDADGNESNDEHPMGFQPVDSITQSYPDEEGSNDDSSDDDDDDDDSDDGFIGGKVGGNRPLLLYCLYFVSVSFDFSTFLF
jgi:ribosome biogenesis protein ENP2